MKPRELTIRGLILGALITTVFTAANIYLSLVLLYGWMLRRSAAVR